MLGSVWVVLPAHVVWLDRKASIMGVDLADQEDEDVHVAVKTTGLHPRRTLMALPVSFIVVIASRLLQT